MYERLISTANSIGVASSGIFLSCGKISGTSMTFLIPDRLQKGDVIGIVSPASPLDDPSRLDAGVRYLEQLGYRIKVGVNVGKRSGYLAGTDQERADDLNGMFEDRSVKAIFCLRGGYGSPRLLPLLRYPMIKRNPKIFVGYSDITALQLALLARCGLVTFQGPMVGVDMIGSMDPVAEDSLWTTLTHPSRGTTIGTGRIAVRGRGPALRRGPILGGNLSLAVSLLGSKFSPEYDDALICLEETGEEPYRIDRMMLHLTITGSLTVASAIVSGSFTACEPRNANQSSASWEEVLKDYAFRSSIPLVSGLPFGHMKGMITLPIGVLGRLDLKTGLLQRTGASVR
jgi:muramoyltetrapeptide carboxypeptidase